MQQLCQSGKENTKTHKCHFQFEHKASRFKMELENWEGNKIGKRFAMAFGSLRILSHCQM